MSWHLWLEIKFWIIFFFVCDSGTTTTSTMALTLNTLLQWKIPGWKMYWHLSHMLSRFVQAYPCVCQQTISFETLPKKMLEGVKHIVPKMKGVNRDQQTFVLLLKTVCLQLFWPPFFFWVKLFFWGIMLRLILPSPHLLLLLLVWFFYWYEKCESMLW